MKRLLTLTFCLLAACAALQAQTTTTVPEGVLSPTQNGARINGVRVEVAPDGAVWFLESSADIIARLKDGVIKRWQIRPTGQLGANPVDFELDGDLVWFIESGESQIPAGSCAYGRLDTSTNQLTEWVVQGTIPAAFYRAPDGLVWLPQSAAVLQSLNLDTLEVINHRSPLTYAYADMVVAPDGAFWLADFGDNRIVRWVPGAETETSWTFFPLSGGRLNPAQIQLDADGTLWIAQRSANRIDHFDPVAGNGGSPILAGDRLVYVAECATAPGIVALDKITGKTVWRAPRALPPKMKFSFGTPLLIEVNGEKQIVDHGQLRRSPIS